MAIKFFVDKRAYELFKKLIEEEHSPFYGMDFKDVFIFAMALGYATKRRKPLESKRELAYIDVFNDLQQALIKSIAITTERKLEVLMNEKEIFRIAEEYANEGIYMLYELIFKSEEPLDALDKMVTSLVK